MTLETTRKATMTSTMMMTLAATVISNDKQCRQRFLQMTAIPTQTSIIGTSAMDRQHENRKRNISEGALKTEHLGVSHPDRIPRN
jgi:hypothetical protein